MTTTGPVKNQRIQVPDSLRDVLLEFSIAYLSEQPKDVVDYAVEFFTKLQEKRNHSNNMVSVEINSPDEESIMSQEDGKWETDSGTIRGRENFSLSLLYPRHRRCSRHHPHGKPSRPNWYHWCLWVSGRVWWGMGWSMKGEEDATTRIERMDG